MLILPLLREQRILTDAVGYLSGLAMQHGKTVVVLVTTERENHEPDPARVADPSRPSTIDMARALAAGVPTGVVRHLHYPDADGVMVHQVNFAAHSELARLAEDGIDPRQVWVAVYNADSRPHPATLGAVADLAGSALQPRPRIVQQSALFTTNLHGFPPGAQGAVLAGAAVLQSRWTLAREVPRLRRQARQARSGGVRWPRLAHCVGHGLFVRGDEFLVQGGLPTEPMNEDLAFGYLACAGGTPIDPMPLRCSPAGGCLPLPRPSARCRLTTFCRARCWPRTSGIKDGTCCSERGKRSAGLRPCCSAAPVRGGVWSTRCTAGSPERPTLTTRRSVEA